MTFNYPDPSLSSSFDFYSSAFRIKRLLRRRGYEEVLPMNDEVWGFMPPQLYKKWLSFTKRKKLIKEPDGTKEFERFVAQIISQYYCNPSTFSNKILDLAPGGDFDVLVEGSGETLFHFETKTSVGNTNKSVDVPEIWNFMVRESRLGVDMSVFLFDSNYDLEKNLIIKFEILYTLAKYISTKDGLKPLQEINIKNWLKNLTKDNFTRTRIKINRNVYFIYWPVLIINGGDSLKKNLGKAISLYYTGIRHLSPFTPFRNPPNNQIFQDLPTWQKLPKGMQAENIRRKINSLVES